MHTALHPIQLLDLLWALIPVLIMIGIYVHWTGDKTTLPTAITRMVLQLIMIGYLLTYLFKSTSSTLIMIVLFVMLFIASIIALRPLAQKTRIHYLYAFISIMISTFFTLFIILQGVLHISPWYTPSYIIPLSGMLFAAAMNSVSIAAERFESQQKQDDFHQARIIAYKTALIPTINTLFAVGLVSLPGMMTGQILSGVDPLIAVRYQIMVMLMILGASGISSALYLSLLKKPK